MRLIGRPKGYWKRIWKAQNTLNKARSKYNGNALTSKKSCTTTYIIHPVPTVDPSGADSKIVPSRDMEATPKVVSVQLDKGAVRSQS